VVLEVAGSIPVTRPTGVILELIKSHDMSLPIFYCRDIQLSFGKHSLFSNASFNVNKKDKICLVGRNGSGKSTLLKIVSQKIEPDKGKIFLPPSIRTGYLSQDTTFKSDQSVKEFALENLNFSDEQELEEKSYLVDIILGRLSLKSEKMISKLSGGKVRRAALARTLVNVKLHT
jgi:ABC transport system ATP-binding/permease protein